MIRVFMSLVLALTCAFSVYAYDIKNVEVIRLLDGDTFVGFTPEIGSQKIRIWGIDCPEKKQTYSPQCTNFLSSLISGRKVDLQVKNKDQYGRLVSRVFVSGDDVGLKMVRMGYAYHARNINKDRFLKQAEIDARRQCVGMWSLENPPTEPWVYRRVPKWQ